MVDEDNKGPGWVRNQLLKQVSSEFVVFLDADDWLEPTFNEECFKAYQPGKYVYTDWYKDGEWVQTPDKAWCDGTWHPITALIKTTDVRGVGGFDESLPAIEDTDFYMKLTRRYICGVRVPRPLLHYGKEGRRAKAVHEDGSVNVLKDTVLMRYRNQMGCCGDMPKVDETIPIGEKQPGDVLAMAVWVGNRREYGRATGRRYPRMSNPKMTWVSPSDIAARPDHWQEVILPGITNEEPLEGIDGFDMALRLAGKVYQASEQPTMPIRKNDIRPSIAEIIEAAKKRL